MVRWLDENRFTMVSMCVVHVRMFSWLMDFFFFFSLIKSKVLVFQMMGLATMQDQEMGGRVGVFDSAVIIACQKQLLTSASLDRPSSLPFFSRHLPTRYSRVQKENSEQGCIYLFT